MSQDDVTAAISAALASDWKSAEKINQKILADCPNDVDCLNRLGKAFLEQGEPKKASLIFKKVLKINKYDPIARKNLERANQTKTNGKAANQAVPHAPVNFLEEPGKTKLVSLVNVASAGSLLKQGYAEIATLTPRKHTIMVSDQQGTYLGALPDDLGHRLSLLMKGGNKYECFVKSVCKNGAVVFLRETLRVKKYSSTPSFPASGAEYFSFVREDTVSPADSPTKSTSPDEDLDDDGPGKPREDEEEATE